MMYLKLRMNDVIATPIHITKYCNLMDGPAQSIIIIYDVITYC